MKCCYCLTNKNIVPFYNTYCVPTTLSVFISDSSPPKVLAKPKSDIFGFKLISNKILLAFRSL